MLATSACDQERPTLVLFAHIALQVQIMLRICFNRGNLTCVLGYGRFWGPLGLIICHPQPMGGKSTRPPQTFWPQGIGRLNFEEPHLQARRNSVLLRTRMTNSGLER
jgi:hypothetical protein